MNKEIAAIENRSVGGLREAALLVKADAMKQTPLKTGNLRGSAYTQNAGTKSEPSVEIGYTAAYAVYVHEIAENKHPIGNWKFLQYALQNSVARTLEIIRQAATVGGAKA
jgi:Zn-dependent metalloprotease